MRRENYKKLEICLFGLLICLIILSNVLATDITIKTRPSREVTLNIINPTTEDLIKSIEGTSDKEGKAYMNFSVEKAIVDLAVIVRFDGKITSFKKFTGYSTSGPISIDLTTPPIITLNLTNSSQNNQTENKNETLVQPINPIANQVNNSNNTAEIIESSNLSAINSSVSGFSIFDITNPIKSVISSKITYYIIGGLFAVAILVFIMKLIIVKRRSGEFGGFKPWPRISGHSDYTIKDRQLLEAERKIKQAQEELEAIKQRKRKLVEAEARYEEAKRELEKARKYGF